MSIMKNRSRFLDFISFLSTVRGDISNITAPPFLLAPVTAVELPRCWTERPSLLAAPAMEVDAEKRALLVLKWFLCSLKSQSYIGQDVNAGIKKPINAFLGELFIGEWTDDTSTAKVISEQVSHHPPITACFMWDDKNGIRATGYTRVEITFSGSVNVKQIGHAILHIDKYDEDYLIPFPDLQVKGIFSGKLYPELTGTYHIISSTGYISEITFTGKNLFSGLRNSFEARMYRKEDVAKTPIYTATGTWSNSFTITDSTTKTILETCTPSLPAPAPLHLPPLTDQDPFETRRAWQHVLSALATGNMQAVSAEKSKLEEAQRGMRKKELAEGREWEALFFSSRDGDDVFDGLVGGAGTGWRLHAERTKGVWGFDAVKAERARRPFRGAGGSPLG